MNRRGYLYLRRLTLDLVRRIFRVDWNRGRDVRGGEFVEGRSIVLVLVPVLDPVIVLRIGSRGSDWTQEVRAESRMEARKLASMALVVRQRGCLRVMWVREMIVGEPAQRLQLPVSCAPASVSAFYSLTDLRRMTTDLERLTLCPVRPL